MSPESTDRPVPPSGAVGGVKGVCLGRGRFVPHSHVCSVQVLQLVLEADSRSYLPPFPDKPAVALKPPPRLVLCVYVHLKDRQN